MPDLYWVHDNGEAYGASPNEMLVEGVIDPEIGDKVHFSCAVHVPDETWQLMAVDDDGQPCPKCGGLGRCEDFLGEGCGADDVRMVQVG
jgi:hypothetical protein